MPGIVAIIDGRSAHSASNESLLISMSRAIAHENWHKMNMYSEFPLYVARVHLGITNAEPQPIFNEDKSLCIFMDGEVFGYHEEKKELELKGHKFEFNNDPEFCLHLFEEYGEAFVEKLNGSFVLLIYDVKDKRILIANDRHGLRPIYHTKNGSKHIFSSEVKAILKDETFEKEMDHEAVSDLFAFGRILGNKTLFKKIKLMPPGSMTTWSNEEITQKKYWDFTFEEKWDPNQTEEYCIDKLVTLFRKAVERRTKGKHHLGIFLSGGLDSRTIAGAIDKRSYPVYTFTYGVKGGDEAKIAKRIAEKLGMEHEFIELRKDYLALLSEKAVYLTDGMLNVAHIYWMSSLEEARKRADIMFHGTFLDIMLGTYLSRVAFRHSLNKISQIFLEHRISQAKWDAFADLLYEAANNLVTDAMAPLFYSETYYKKIQNYPKKSFKECLSETKGTDAINRTDYFMLESIARNNLSIVILRNYLEDRVPGADNDFFDYVLSIPSRLRFGTRLYYKFLTKLAPELASIPYQRTGVPPSWPVAAHSIGFMIKGGYKLLVRKLRSKTGGLVSFPQKIGYPDLDEYIRTDVKTREFFRNILLDEKTLSRGYFNANYVTNMFNEHMSCKKDLGTELCALLTFELWHRLFID